MHLPIVHAGRRVKTVHDGRLKILLPVAAGAAGIALVRAVAPTIIRAAVNVALRYNRRVSGRVDGLHLHLMRGEVAVSGIRLARRDRPADQIVIDNVRFDVRPSSLLRRRLSGGVTVENVRIRHED